MYLRRNTAKMTGTASVALGLKAKDSEFAKIEAWFGQ